MKTTEQLLIEATEALLFCGCQFFACEGYDKEPEDMRTCNRCATLYEIKTTAPHIWQQCYNKD
jgi:hypothetical protein